MPSNVFVCNEIGGMRTLKNENNDVIQNQLSTLNQMLHKQLQYVQFPSSTWPLLKVCVKLNSHCKRRLRRNKVARQIKISKTIY